ncbi:hypothetical protein PC116_g22613 [Phytophthora cactorum]|nr:hypothetical protein PC116_g22613 [Phytophthora cactorum]
MFLSMGKRPLRTLINDDLPDPGWPKTSVMVPGLKIPLVLLRISLRMTFSFDENIVAFFLIEFQRVGSWWLEPSSSATTISAEMDKLLNRTSICGSGRPMAASKRVATWSCNTRGP